MCQCVTSEEKIVLQQQNNTTIRKKKKKEETLKKCQIHRNENAVEVNTVDPNQLQDLYCHLNGRTFPEIT